LSSYGERIELVSKPNTGLSDTRNYAARLCQTPYLLFLDADNRLPPDFVRLTRSALEASGAAFAYTQLRYFGDSDTVTTYPSFDAERLRRGNYIDAGALLRSEVVRAFAYDVRLRHGLEDWDFYLSLVAAGHEGTLVEETVLWFRRHGSSMGDAVQRAGWRRRRTYLRIMWKHRDLFGPQVLRGYVSRSARHQLRRFRERASR
jgi:glycosyltransferase involved in cell wall biosynthesis